MPGNQNLPLFTQITKKKETKGKLISFCADQSLHMANLTDAGDRCAHFYVL